MKADHVSYQRAVSRSLLGLGLQLGMGLAALIYAVIYADHAALTAALLILAGGGVWLLLAVVYDQHRRERLEALEAQTLAAQAARSSTVFEESADDLRVAARRLRTMHRLLVPAGSLLIAGAFAGIGFWRLDRGLELFKPNELVLPSEQGWAIALAVGMAVVGFLYARYISGMARQLVWSNLRAGAAQSMGAALLGLAMIIAYLVGFTGNDQVVRALPAAFAIFGIVLGAEIVLNFVLNLYRPRQADRMPRPAMESNILAFAAAPDRLADTVGGALNYQFGFDVTGSWVYQLLSRSIAWLLLLGAAVVWLMTSLYVVNPDQRGLLITQGRFVREVGPGIGVKWPWPISKVERFNATTSRRLDLATPSSKGERPILWTTQHGVEEVNMLIRAPVAETAGIDGSEGDFSILSVVVPLIYSVEDLDKFNAFGEPEVRDKLLTAIGRRELTRYFAGVRSDALLGPQRQDISEEILRRLDDAYAAANTGIRVLFAGVEGVHPPTSVAPAFEEVVRKEQDVIGALELARDQATREYARVAGSEQAARQIIEALNTLDRLKQAGDPAAAEAEIEAQRLILASQGEAAVKIRAAQAERWRIHMEARGEAERFDAQRRAFEAAPEYFMTDIYLRSLQDAMKEARVYIVVDDRPIEYRTDLTEQAASGNLFQTPNAEQE